MAKRTEIRIPSMGESVTEGVLAQWLKEDGEWVDAGEALIEFESDKASLALPSPARGLVRHGASAGATLAVDAVAGWVEEADAPPPSARQGKTGETVPAPAAAQPPAPPAEAAAPPPPLPAREPSPAAPLHPAAGGSPVRTERRTPLSPLRKQVAQRLVASRAAAAHVSTFNEVDVGALKELRVRCGPAFEEKFGIRFGYTGFFVLACARALRDWPAVNAAVDSEEITWHDYVDISVAVSTDRGLLTPVLRNVETMDLAGIERGIRDFADRARDRRIMPDELRGGTFTVTNGGIFGSLLSTPIPNPPQTAVLGMHSIQDRPVVRDGQIVVRPMMYLALTYDHRLLDGKEAVGFLCHVRDLVEDPARLALGL